MPADEPVVRRIRPDDEAQIVAGGKDQLVFAGFDRAEDLALGDGRQIRDLVDNAQRHTTTDVAVTITDEDHHVVVEVRDDGPGIPADRTEAIFEPFVQLRVQYGPSSEGTGLGLAISRDLARGMKGDITVAAADGGGSVFTLVLPAAQPAA